jgi:hypothetical protein
MNKELKPKSFVDVAPQVNHGMYVFYMIVCCVNASVCFDKMLW